MKSPSAVLLALSLLTPLPAMGEQYKLDPAATTIEFEIKSFGLFSTHGVFDTSSGEISFDAASPDKTTALVTIDTASVRTGKESRDIELRGPAFFASDAFPHLVFRSTSLTKTGSDTGILTGQLTLRGITKPMELDVLFGSAALPATRPDEPPHPRIAFSASGFIHRSEFGMTRYLPFLSDRVTLTIRAEAAKN